MENNDNNKLIAQFMGATFEEVACFHANVDIFKLPKGQYFPTGLDEAWINHLCYHSSFDWLMPVVEKIETIPNHPYAGFSVRIIQNSCTIYCHEYGKQDGIIYQTPFNESPESKIKAIYDAVIDFITWYNNTQH